jgi:tight adherence protein B
MGLTSGMYGAALLAAVAAAGGAWALAAIGETLFARWRSRMVDEADVSFGDMLNQMPAARYINRSLYVAVLVGLAVGALTGRVGREWSWTFALCGGVVAFFGVVMAARWLLGFLQKLRLEKFNDQLEEALLGMSNALRAGFSITQAIEMVVKQKRQPISVEFSLMLQQTRLGMTFDDALKNMNARVKSEDFELVSGAIRTARLTGGDLTGVFDRLAAMIRERRRIQRRIQTLTAQGRLQGRVLASLPMFLLLILYWMKPDMVRDFFSQTAGIAIFLLVVVLEICGFLFIRKIVNIDI